MRIELSVIKPGLALVLLGLAFGIALGVAFGVNEDVFKDFVAQGIAAHPDIHDAKSQDKIWRYAQRAHFHSTGIAAFSIGLLLLVSLSTISHKLKKTTSVLIGLGALLSLCMVDYVFARPFDGSQRSAFAHCYRATNLCRRRGFSHRLSYFGWQYIFQFSGRSK